MQETRDRVVKEFMELTAIDAVSFSERKMADALMSKLESLGITAVEVNSDEALSLAKESVEEGTPAGAGESAGNIYGRLEGSIPGAPILLSAHMDTVMPGIGKKAILAEDGRIAGRGTQVLGADDCSGLSEILEGLRRALASGKPHRDVEILFTFGEEKFCSGAKVFDYSQLGAKDGYVLDMSGDVGKIAMKAPSIMTFEIKAEGRSSHAGFCPEKGLHAVKAMAEAISLIETGRIDEETTVNVGTIEGGEDVNIVPASCTARGEIRSYKDAGCTGQLAEIGRILELVSQKTGVSLSLEADRRVKAYEVSEDDAAMLRFCSVIGASGGSPILVNTFGGSDANVFRENGIDACVISCGMANSHSTEEYIYAEQLDKAADLVAALIQSEI